MERLLILVSLIAGIYSEGDNDLVDLGVGLDIDLNLGLGGGCVSVRGCNLDLNLPEQYLEQPYFITFLPKTGDNTMLDNVCYTYFKLPDTPVTFQLYESRVYCDGSTAITSHVITQCDIGRTRAASPYCTFTDTTFAYAGCDTFLNYRCLNHGDCQRDNDGNLGYVYGLSKLCRAMGLSCLKKVEEVICDHGIPEQQYYVLPMKLPNKCVTSQICLIEKPVVEFARAVGVERIGPPHVEAPIRRAIEGPLRRVI